MSLDHGISDSTHRNRIDYSRDSPAREVALSTGLGNGVRSSSMLGVALDPDPEAEAFSPSSVPVIIDAIESRSDSSDTGVDIVYDVDSE